MKMKPNKYFWIFQLLCWSMTLLIGQNETMSPEVSLKQADQLYQDGKYKQAASLYAKIEAAGLTSSTLQYNMGNAYFKADSLAQALLHYERALRLSPKDAEIQHNIDFARKSIEFKAETYPLIFYKRWLKNLVDTFSSTIWLILGVLLIWGAFWLARQFLYGKNKDEKKRFFGGASIVAFLSLLCLIFAFTKYSYEQQKAYAIIFTQEAQPIKTAPSEDSQTQFKLSAGNKIKVVDSIDDWTKIQLEDDKEGWIETKFLRTI